MNDIILAIDMPDEKLAVRADLIAALGFDKNNNILAVTLINKTTEYYEGVDALLFTTVMRSWAKMVRDLTGNEQQMAEGGI